MHAKGTGTGARRIPKILGSTAGLFLCGCVLGGVGVLGWTLPAFAQSAFPDAPPAADAAPVPVQLFQSRAGAPATVGLAQPLADNWTATYRVGLAEETSVQSTFLRFDRALDAARLAERRDRNLWRHFLGLEFAAGGGFALHGGIAKSSGNGGFRVIPTGYERLRVNSGARWRGENWGLDGAFAFIPTGATRFPGQAGFMPGTGSSGSTWLMSLSLSRRF